MVFFKNFQFKMKYLVTFLPKKKFIRKYVIKLFRLSSFRGRDTKLERFLATNQCSKRKGQLISEGHFRVFKSIKNNNELILRISAVTSKRGQITKIQALHYVK